MIDTEREQLRLLTKASADVPGNPHVSTLIRWWQRGVRGVRLETILVGGRRYTSIEAVQRFITRLSESPASHYPPLSRQRQREIDDVERRLDDEGIK